MNLDKLNVSDLRSILKNHYAKLNKAELIKSIQGLNLHNIEALEERKAFITDAKQKLQNSEKKRKNDISKINQINHHNEMSKEDMYDDSESDSYSYSDDDRPDFDNRRLKYDEMELGDQQIVNEIVLDTIGYSLKVLGKSQKKIYVQNIMNGMHPVKAYENAKPSVLKSKTKIVRTMTTNDILHDPSLITVNELKNASKDKIKDLLNISIGKVDKLPRYIKERKILKNSIDHSTKNKVENKYLQKMKDKLKIYDALISYYSPQGEKVQSIDHEKYIEDVRKNMNTKIDKRLSEKEKLDKIENNFNRKKDNRKIEKFDKPVNQISNNPWVNHLAVIKSKEGVTHQQAMILAKDPKNKYFYSSKPTKVIKPKKEKKVNKCDICEKVFFDKSGLNRHMLTHKNDLSKIRGLIKRQEFYLNNKNVDSENKKNAPKIISELKEKFAKISSHFKDTPAMKTPPKTATKQVKSEKQISPKIVDDLITRINKSNDNDFHLTKYMIIGTSKKDGIITLKTSGLIVDPDEMAENISEIKLIPNEDEFEAELWNNEDLYETIHVY